MAEFDMDVFGVEGVLAHVQEEDDDEEMGEGGDEALEEVGSGCAV